MEILYEDKYLLVVKKPVGMLSQGLDGVEGKVLEYLHLKNGGFVGLINRLDRNVSGLIMLAKDRESAKRLNNMASEHKIKKEYLAVIHSAPEEKDGTLKDFLFKDSKSNKSYVVKTLRKGAKEAILNYNVIKTVNTEKGIISLIKVTLKTGRTHQIRVQFASRKMPILGDGKYGGGDNKCKIALYSHKMSFNHPFTNEDICIESYPDVNTYPWNILM